MHKEKYSYVSSYVESEIFAVGFEFCLEVILTVLQSVLTISRAHEIINRGAGFMNSARGGKLRHAALLGYGKTNTDNPISFKYQNN